ncbi:MAG: ubiquinone biosynthesis regulatory protein kinase UbiB [Candidatus Sedimenticola endophacoides]|uniref:Probable protein kinase UbiB n=2 Tax=Candidatus Sedimenticola endophacoides TaxID=2548426 RepID=A0A6N4DIJ8_9GAMM|nr:MAG: ubiquinone biosynthesis regulatory protein kinase UbiB [Candidatus Sedimenticola endophacoides]OQX39912.1 MAG: ubiquinone biosynthesis regulatory protein kinase UbiB [Candidatus Sedimenticola endophacoides]OQX46567.1 MAG: ubiquinone biosynthesis regulatory protein kinase UbiB [Candidatus Sedimenticola endophacoides]PUD99739.1 MAG: ubiquinone biosynthesis regulatory protein kinase UbiB [Candidatus Sedimenticola endophacoides]PUE00750.1 MAG: ubiquinone biosynthesis regulatory protein kina
MIRPSEALRLIHINWVLVRHGLDEVILATHLLRPVRFLLYLSPGYWLRRNTLPPFPVRIRLALEELGPIFVKFGQILSTRRDLLPGDIADELARLQDAVPPFPGTQARRIIERAYGHPIEEVLDAFDETPMASASIAQVHAASLKSGEQVVVKVLRPDIERVIRRDVGLLYIIARLANRYWKDGRRLRPLDVVRDYEKTILDELDLQREAANAAQLRRNWEGSPLLFVPEVHWELTRKNVLVLERIHGTPVSDVAALRAQGVSMKQLGEQGVEIFFTQVFRDNFFHADMHPGNIFVEPGGRYIAVDFGIVGSLTTEDQRYLAENLLAFFNRDYHRVAELHVESGWVPHTTRVDEFEASIRSVCEPIFNKPLSEISFGHFLLNLFQTARRFDMEIQPQLVLLQKTLLYIEGLGRQLYPELDLWTTAKPFMERWMKEQVGPGAFARKLRKNLPLMSEHAADMPLLLHKVLDDAAHGRLELRWRSDELRQLHQGLRQGQRQIIAALAGAAMLIAGALLLTLGPSLLMSPEVMASAGAMLSGGGLLTLLTAWWRGGR